MKKSTKVDRTLSVVHSSSSFVDDVIYRPVVVLEARKTCWLGTKARIDLVASATIIVDVRRHRIIFQTRDFPRNIRLLFFPLFFDGVKHTQPKSKISSNDDCQNLKVLLAQTKRWNCMGFFEGRGEVDDVEYSTLEVGMMDKR